MASAYLADYADERDDFIYDCSNADSVDDPLCASVFANPTLSNTRVGAELAEFRLWALSSAPQPYPKRVFF